MSAAHFQYNTSLTQQLKGKSVKTDTNLFVGQRLGEGTYSASYLCMINGEYKIIRMFKYMGPNDRLDMKLNNIRKELAALEQLNATSANAPASVADKLAKLNVALRNIEYTGPIDEKGEQLFWADQPITDGNDQFVAYQICKHIPGRSLAQIQGNERADPAFAIAIGEQLGRILAQFHHAAAEVSFPYYRTMAELKGNDHAYRHVRMAVDRSTAKADHDDDAVAYQEIAEMIDENTERLFYSPQFHTPIHGDLGLGNIIVEFGQLTGIVDWDKARRSLPEYDFRGITLMPAAFDSAIASYFTELKKLGHHEHPPKYIKIFKATALKLALAVHTACACAPETDAYRLARGENNAWDREKMAVSIIVDQLAKLDPAYIGAAAAMRSHTKELREKYPHLQHCVT